MLQLQKLVSDVSSSSSVTTKHSTSLLFFSKNLCNLISIIYYAQTIPIYHGNILLMSILGSPIRVLNSFFLRVLGNTITLRVFSDTVFFRVLSEMILRRVLSDRVFDRVLNYNFLIRVSTDILFLRSWVFRFSVGSSVFFFQ